VEFYDFDQSVGFWLIRTAQTYERALNTELAPRGITFRQAQVMGWLAYEGEMSQSTLADRMHIEPPTLVGILDRMERDGWISRQDCSTDRRKKMIRLQPQADPVWHEILQCAKQVRARATSGMNREQVDTLRELLTKVQTNLSSAEALAPVAPQAK
jgi:MarR family transcriptional regulator, transcriptional regulator for hemolysin